MTLLTLTKWITGVFHQSHSIQLTVYSGHKRLSMQISHNYLTEWRLITLGTEKSRSPLGGLYAGVPNQTSADRSRRSGSTVPSRTPPGSVFPLAECDRNFPQGGLNVCDLGVHRCNGACGTVGDVVVSDNL